MLKKVVVVLVGVLLVAGAIAGAIIYQKKKTEYEPPPLATADEVNGIRYSDYADFYKNWKLVTVTFRSDNDELRFAYANDLAYETLTKGKTNYPQGAVFAKIPMLTAGDPAFPNSHAPLGSKRYQFMVRDKKKYASTGGWGYAVFDTNGKVFYTPTSGQPKEMVPFDSKIYSAQCVACHEAVKDRNYIFSRIPAYDPHTVQEGVKAQYAGEQGQPIYSDRSVDGLPVPIQKLVPHKYKTVRYLEGGLHKDMYIGTVYESRPLLILEAIRTKKPALLLSKSGRMLDLVEPAIPAQEPTAMPCPEKQKLFVSFWTIGANPDNWVSKDLFCVDTNKQL